jgi:predicted TIM-barrel fold metal-dependent hydrolase
MFSSEVIDSDSHVDESDATWDYIGSEHQKLRPVVGTFDDPDAPNDYWLIDGARQHRAKRSIRDVVTKTSVEARELSDASARLRHMDKLGVSVQIIYPTLFLKNPTLDPSTELALTRSYNRWLADRTAGSNGRLRWICVLPMMSPGRAVEELRFAKDHGACGVFKKGDVEAGHAAWKDYFFPVYSEAERLDMPICFHQGTGKVAVVDGSGTSPESDFIDLKAAAVNGVSVVLTRGVASEFPALRFGCIEVGASWVVLVDHMYKRRLLQRSRRSDESPAPDFEAPVFEPNRIYTTIETTENLGTILRHISEDHLLVGSDYGHADPSQEHGFVPKLHELAARGILSPDGPEKILSNNPRRFYGLDERDV